MQFNEGFELVQSNKEACCEEGAPFGFRRFARADAELWIEIDDAPLAAELAWEGETASPLAQKLWLDE